MTVELEALRKQYPGYVVIVKVGDFWEAFGECAKTLARVLGLSLTARAGLPMAGFPHHTLETYLRKAVASKLRVVLTEPTALLPAVVDVKRILTSLGEMLPIGTRLRVTQRHMVDQDDDETERFAEIGTIATITRHNGDGENTRFENYQVEFPSGAWGFYDPAEIEERFALTS